MGGGELGSGGGDTGLGSVNSSMITFPFLLCGLTGSSCKDTSYFLAQSQPRSGLYLRVLESDSVLTKPLRLHPLTWLGLHLVTELSLRFLWSVAGERCGHVRSRVSHHHTSLLQVLGSHVAGVRVHQRTGSSQHWRTVQRRLRAKPGTLLHHWRFWRCEVLIETLSHVGQILVGGHWRSHAVDVLDGGRP